MEGDSEAWEEVIPNLRIYPLIITIPGGFGGSGFGGRGMSGGMGGGFGGGMGGGFGGFGTSGMSDYTSEFNGFRTA